jgi:hypothetical protein
MSDMNTPEETELDGQLSSYYHDLADSAVPVKLHGRIVGTLGSRGRSQGLTGLGAARPHISKFAPAAILVLAVAAVALAALPWTQHGPTALASQTAPGTSSSTGAASPSGDLTVTVMNLAHGWLQIGLNGEISEKLTCGESGTYQVANPAPILSLTADDGGDRYGPIGPYDLPAHIWLVELATGSVEYDTQPAASDLYTICPTKVFGADASGRVSWDLNTPVASGFAAAAAMNATIDTAVQKLLAQARDSVLATPGETAIVASIYYVNGSGTLNTRWMSLQLAFTVAADTVLNLYQEVNVDMSDGHGVTIEDLFTTPGLALATLSSETTKLVPAAAIGDLLTGPSADNFSNWFPESDGLQFYLRTGDLKSPWAGYAVTVPWSALKGMLKPDSPIWGYIPVG